MFKRRQQNRGSRPSAGADGNNTNVNTYVEDQRDWVDDRSRLDVPRQRERPPRPTPSELKRLPTLPFAPVQESAASPTATDETKYRPASSLYSQPSPRPPYPISAPPDTRSVAAEAYLHQVEISPPSSPDTFAHHKQRNQPKLPESYTTPDVSPIEGPRPLPNQSKIPAPRKPSETSIPVLRRERRRNQATRAATNPMITRNAPSRDGPKTVPGIDTRWDVLTGEPTTGSHGRPSQVKPGEFEPPGSYHEDTSDTSLGIQTTVTAGNARSQPSFSERVRKLKLSSSVNNERPEWKGSSGRAKIVAPVEDQMAVPPLNIPRKSSKRTTSPRIDNELGRKTPLSTVLSSGNVTPALTPTSEIPPATDSLRASAGTERNSAPSDYFPSVAKYEPVVLSTDPIASNTSSGVMDGRRQRPLIPQENPNTSVAPAAKLSAQVTAPLSTTRERNYRELLEESKPVATTRDHLPSRFSVTTYATSTGGTPRQSIESPPPMPSMPQQPSPILHRRRPQNGSIDSPKATMRKAVTSSDPIVISLKAHSPTSDLSSPKLRTSKTLPKSPAEVASVDLISSLTAQIDDLTRQRTNLQESIHQMTELMPTVVQRGAEAKRREEEKRKVEALRNQLADVTREEHDLGLRLHRAWKRQEREAVYEPTSLWVRRVTQ